MTPEDVGLAGQGDPAALRRMRDHWLELASGERFNPLLPRDETLPQVELLAELAAGSGQPEDQLALVVAYHVRIEVLERNKAAAEGLAKEAAKAHDADALLRLTSSIMEFEERLGRYRAKIDALLAAILNSSGAEGSALIVSALTIQADSGDERAITMLQFIMDSVTPERAQAIQAEVRKMEKEAAQ